MSLDILVALGIVGFFLVMVIRQGAVYRSYRATQQQVLDRQAEALALQRESVDTQKEVVRLLTVIATRERS